MYYLGVDTSFYTTSLAAVDASGRVLLDYRRAIPVPLGERGVRPTEAVFFHVQEMTRAAPAVAQLPGRPAGVAASVRPRPVPDSYLPVFRVAEGWGRQLAAVSGAPFHPCSHQEGHLAAGVWSARLPSSVSRFLAVQLSGGTTDLLVCERHGAHFAVRLLSSTIDLHAGQFLDRVGVWLGLPFPAGPSLDALAREGEAGAVTIPSSVREAGPSFAGPASAAERLINTGAKAGDVALEALACLCRTLAKWLARARTAAPGIDDVLFIGGVAANAHLRQHLHVRGLRLHFPEPHYCTDNAVGVALLARAAAEEDVVYASETH